MAAVNLLAIIVGVCDRNGGNRFTRDQVMREIEARALQPGSDIEDLESAKRTASHELSDEVNNKTNGLLRRIDRGEYEWRDPGFCEAWKKAQHMKGDTHEEGRKGS